MSDRTLTAFSLLLLPILFSGCASPSGTGETQIMRAEAVGEGELFATPTALNVPGESAALNDIARFLAGLPPLSGQDAFAGLRKTTSWKFHSQRMDDLWDQFAIRHGRPVNAWASSNLGDLRNANSVFYPFSGPDFLFARLFFPNAETYLMCGLEPCDPLPEWNTLKPDDISAGLEGLVSGLDTVLQYSYFITKEMRTDFQATRFRGVLPTFLVFLARTGHVVHSVNAVRLNPDGSPVIYPGGQATVPGLLIRASYGGHEKRIFYFSQDLADDSLKTDGPFLRFAASLGRPVAFAKSASYLMHESYFSHVRNHILTHCSGLVQDPSGVPFRNLIEHGWKVDLYGGYFRAFDPFEQYQQADLTEAYIDPRNHIEPLRFGIGYLTDPKTTSLMVARPGR
jgi:hypothetical protein